MSRIPKCPLRPTADGERRSLLKLQGSATAPAAQAARAKILLAVAGGRAYLEAARATGRRSGDAVARLVARFNDEGLAAVVPRHGGGQRPRYTAQERELVLAKVRRPPEREREGSATWSLSLLQKALREEGLPQISRHALWHVLREAGLTWQRHRSWCATGTALRQRQRDGGQEVVAVTDPDAEAKKN